MTPKELYAEITKVIMQETGIKAVWQEHDMPLTSQELFKIGVRFESLLAKALQGKSHA